MIEWLSQTIDIPVWALLTLAGYQRVFKLGKQYRQRQRQRKNNSGTSGSEDTTADIESRTKSD